MAGRRVPLELTMDDSSLCRINKVCGIARMIELIKGHPKLLLGLNVFLPEASKELCQSQTIGSTSVSPKLLKVNVPTNLISVEEAFDDEPEKYACRSIGSQMEAS
ncbi:predicted protein [Arabidopsis lyrata subsp. lyrata]|uniref:Predicted protein n=1 Tax=Arabidopsis lyrata subsp. lyrata TaxID=81972 RepID=D7KC49_ARALL|nr:predicted protein [Arabidopsis lyrata subsp. lyrata]